jgi:ribosomal protein L44E
MILMPGKPPYSQQGGGDPISNIKNGQFSYPLGGKSNKKTPDGPWRFIWSHFPYKTKEAFYQCFEKGKRLSAKEWLQIIENYFFSLQKGYLDPSGESNKIFPTTFKGVSQHAREKYGLEEIKQVSFVCDHCHKSFQVDQKRAKQISSHAQKCCRDCAIVFQQMRQTGEMKCCIVCDSQFLFSNSEKQFFESKGFEPPKKCPDCRKSSKQSISQRSSTGKKSNARGTRSTGRSQTSPRPAPQPRSFWDEMVDIWNAFWQ